jgi:acyl-CoA reductase-like NAD-dependent aldehyde dehydrogenase
MKTYLSHYIQGSWVKANSHESFPIQDSSTQEVIATVPSGTARETAQAVQSAKDAGASWASLPHVTRASYLEKIALGLEARTEEIATFVSREVGTPIKISRAVQVGGPIWHWKNFAKLAQDFAWEERVGNSIVLREPIGVVACITPWNFPLSQVTLKVAGALAAGCTVVLKPSELAPISAMILAEVIHESGLPPGVFNLVNGRGSEVGEELASNLQVDMVSFTGSTRAGKRVAHLASQSVKRVALELGGKSASLILPDADLDVAIKGTVSSCLLNSGQTCSALTRMLLPETRYEEAKPLIQAAIKKFSTGPSLDERSRLGPVIGAAQRTRILELIQLGISEGAEVIAGGASETLHDKGYFVEPTALRVKRDDTLAHEEIFGPVLSVLTYTDEEDAISIANGTIYGLGGAVWSANEEHALAVAKRLHTGQIDINGAPFNAHAPFGGYKQSGNGRENGKYGLEEFLEYKSVQVRIR